MNLHRLSDQQRDALEIATEHGMWIDFTRNGATARSLVARDLGTGGTRVVEGRTRLTFQPHAHVATAVRLGALNV